MPLYTYECFQSGHILEKLFPIRDFDLTDTIWCDKCDSLAKRIINNRGALRDKPTYLPDMVKQLVPEDERPFTNRRELQDYKKKHGIEEKCGYGPRLVSI